MDHDEVTGEKMKDNVKNMIMLAGIALMVFLSFHIWFRYETDYKIMFIERVESQDGRTAVIFQMRGEPGKSFFADGGQTEPTKGRVIVKRDGEEIRTEDFSVLNNEVALREENWDVEFYPAGVEIALYHIPLSETAGEEDPENRESGVVREEAERIRVCYDNAGFSGYSEEEIISEITARYDGRASYLRTENGRYYFQADGFEFSAADDFYMSDDYEEAYFGFLAREFSYDHNRITEFEKELNEQGQAVYTPVVGFHGRQAGEAEAFSNACCDLVEELQEIVGFDRIGYFEGEERCYFDLAPYLEGGRMELYNALYLAIEEDSMEVWKNENEPEKAPEAEEEMPEVWKNYDADCFYTKKDGTQLRMVGVDRAAGSSFYVLLEAKNGVSVSVVNRDPYLGHGGGAMWIDFLEDEKIGFSCLSYSGGNLGSLYRTQDGGKSFEEITWPSANRKLPDGSLYNPFVMPDRVWEEEGKLKMLVGQGPNGDYYEDGVWVYGLYESEDMGRNWSYIGTKEGKDTRE